MVRGEAGCISYSIYPLNFSAPATVVLGVNADVKNTDANYNEKFWDEVYRHTRDDEAMVVAATKKTNFYVCTGIRYALAIADTPYTGESSAEEREKYAVHRVKVELTKGKSLTVYKYAAVLSSENHPKETLVTRCVDLLGEMKSIGFAALLDESSRVWEEKWEECDITIEGDLAAQQGIRFNIFQLMQTYTGEDERLNIGPKGFTGEKYGGSTYWDTEAYCLPFFMSTAEPHVARNLLIYRYKHLGKAIENASKLGFNNGAALYPMVTMNGEECHNEWEITFEEIHRNGAIAYAIYDYIRYTGDKQYLADYGLEVLIAISRFWAQRVNWSEAKNKFVILGVTGPNEYENNVNNNWYTNYIASWTLGYTLEAIDTVRTFWPDRYQAIMKLTQFNSDLEPQAWKRTIQHMYLPVSSGNNVFIQQDGFMDKMLLSVNELAPVDRPLNQKWSWDRILRSCFIKQADVLQGLYFFEDRFDRATLKSNFDFYEPMTVHESSLSPCVHAILASRLGYKRKAYELYLRTSRLDLDDYNNDTEDGCHITSMAGTWMSIVKGFGGMQVKDEELHFNPFIPDEWQSYSFRIEFRNRVVKIVVTRNGVEAFLLSGEGLRLHILGEAVELVPPSGQLINPLTNTKNHYSVAFS
ncbi:family 65 glycosyl hydrolase domain-containing protein [Oscillatoria amoena NRMC-F 0135]|nr:family 65 glycosyl hydrolase domain-containing protein [Oscillatoria amoena NRMC-F 0135]